MKKLLSFIALVLMMMSLQACGDSSQSTGLLFSENYTTPICTPLQKSFSVLNDNRSEAQFIEEMSIDEIAAAGARTGYFRINQVTVGEGDRIQRYTGPRFQNILIPPGGTMSLQVTYNPRPVTLRLSTSPDPVRQISNRVVARVNMQLRNSQTATRQIGLEGFTQGGSEASCGTTFTFNVNRIRLHVKTPAMPADQVTEIMPSTPTTILMNANGEEISLSQTDFPTIAVNIPGVMPLNAQMGADATGIYDETMRSINYDNFTVNVSAVSFTSKFTTSSTQDTNGDLNISLSGQAIQSTGAVRFVFVSKTPDDDLRRLGEIAAPLVGGVIGFEVEATLAGS